MQLLKEYPILKPIHSHFIVAGVAIVVGLIIGGLINWIVSGSLSGLGFIGFAIYATCIFFSIKWVYADNIIKSGNAQDLGYFGIMLFLGEPIPNIILLGTGNYALLPFNIIRIAYVDMKAVSRPVAAKGTSKDGTVLTGTVTVQYRPMDVFRVFYVSESLITEGFTGIINSAADAEIGEYDYLDIVASKKDVREKIIQSIKDDISDKPGHGNDLEDYNVRVMSVTTTDFEADAKTRESLNSITKENVEHKSQDVEQEHYNHMVKREFDLIMSLNPKMDKSQALMQAIDQINIRTGKMQQPSMQRIVFEGNKVDGLTILGSVGKK